MIFFGQAKAPSHFARQHRRNIIAFLLFCTKVAEHQRLYQIADDTILVLQVIVQAESFMRQMLPDPCHAQIGTVLAAKFLRQGIAIMAGRIGDLPHFYQQ